MGLDMYLSKVKREEVGYWRKANQVRAWLVNRARTYGMDIEDTDCVVIELFRNDIVDLIADCKAVLDNHELASKLMPTSRGFFFGSMEYDDCYFSDLQQTVDMLEPLLEEVDWDSETIEYYESW